MSAPTPGVTSIFGTSTIFGASPPGGGPSPWSSATTAREPTFLSGGRALLGGAYPYQRTPPTSIGPVLDSQLLTDLVVGSPPPLARMRSYSGTGQASAAGAAPSLTMREAMAATLCHIPVLGTAPVTDLLDTEPLAALPLKQILDSTPNYNDSIVVGGTVTTPLLLALSMGSLVALRVLLTYRGRTGTNIVADPNGGPQRHASRGETVIPLYHPNATTEMKILLLAAGAESGQCPDQTSAAAGPLAVRLHDSADTGVTLCPSSDSQRDELTVTLVRRGEHKPYSITINYSVTSEELPVFLATLASASTLTAVVVETEGNPPPFIHLVHRDHLIAVRYMLSEEKARLATCPSGYTRLVHITDRAGRTGLIMAALNSQVRMVKLLLDHHADPLPFRTASGETYDLTAELDGVLRTRREELNRQYRSQNSALFHRSLPALLLSVYMAEETLCLVRTTSAALLAQQRALAPGGVSCRALLVGQVNWQPVGWVNPVFSPAMSPEAFRFMIDRASVCADVDAVTALLRQHIPRYPAWPDPPDSAAIDAAAAALRQGAAVAPFSDFTPYYDFTHPASLRVARHDGSSDVLTGLLTPGEIAGYIWFFDRSAQIPRTDSYTLHVQAHDPAQRGMEPALYWWTLPARYFGPYLAPGTQLLGVDQVVNRRGMFHFPLLAETATESIRDATQAQVRREAGPDDNYEALLVGGSDVFGFVNLPADVRADFMRGGALATVQRKHTN